jgi:hypothetical protein
MDINKYKSNIYIIRNDQEFSILSEYSKNYHYNHNSTYKEFLSLVDNGHINKLRGHFYFLPIEFFKKRKVITNTQSSKNYFESSGTTGQQTSKHYYGDLELYEKSFLNCFHNFYGSPADYCIIALLPSYHERERSSLIYMAKHLISNSKNNDSGFYLDSLESLPDKLNQIKKTGSKLLLLGVTYALLDFAENYPVDLSGHIVMETGGMKGRRKELIREEVHDILKKGFCLENIHSEYGMTELFSQAYAVKNGLFRCPPWMKIVITEIHDPFTPAPFGVTGNINVIDLANIESCPFLATQDLGRMYADGSFEVLGRMDNSEIRGCNLMVI